MRNPVSTRDWRSDFRTPSNFLPSATFFAKALLRDSPNLSERPMSVWSWRSLSLSASDLEELSANASFCLTILRVLSVVALPPLTLSGCNTAPRPDLVFNRNGLSAQDMSRANAECNLEAEKAAMQARNSVTAGETWRKIFVLCMESKGARYVGTSAGIRM
ncbi:hypothetical protein [Microvirga thermotolerans]|uniref:hypothetical protein n=1 Tax=Microvirga thermotolerans TaxID=2651334 RepID=UPI003CCCD426